MVKIQSRAARQRGAAGYTYAERPKGFSQRILAAAGS